jgi:SagB-type dehydrogenase family enzyme
MDKVRERFFYLRMKSRGYADKVIQDEIEVNDEDYARIVKEYDSEVAETQARNIEAKEIVKKFTQLTSPLYAPVSDQMNGVPKPEIFKNIQGEVIKLPNPQTIKVENNDFRAILENRKSIREYTDVPLSKDELSYLLWLTQGVKEVKETAKNSVTLRTVPSAGARHPFETYLYINRVEGIEAGLYFYNAAKHNLVLLDSNTETQEKLLLACNRQGMIKKSAVNFIWSVIPQRTAWRYGSRTGRYIYLDAGHVCQNLYLAGESINCGVCGIGAFVDEFINDFLGLDGENEFVIYLAAVGKKVSAE